MTKKVLIQSQEFERAAEVAGGYVADPETLKDNPEGRRRFAVIRQYSLLHGKPISKLTAEDYQKMGIAPIGR